MFPWMLRRLLRPFGGFRGQTAPPRAVPIRGTYRLPGPILGTWQATGAIRGKWSANPVTGTYDTGEAY